MGRTDCILFEAIVIIMNHLVKDDEGRKEGRKKAIKRSPHTSLSAIYIDITPPPPRSVADGYPVFWRPKSDITDQAKGWSK